MFPETLTQFEKALKEKYPDINIKWFQNGSENINAKIALEQMSNDVKADLVVSADIFWFKKMADKGFFEPYKPNLGYEVPAEFQDKDNCFTSPRISSMVIAYNKQYVKDADAPKSFSELADPKWKGKIASGSPLESGTNYALMTNLTFKYGYDFLKKLHANDLLSAGGNSAVMQRIVTGERPVGMILLESVLNEQKRNPNIALVYPTDGTVVIPGPMGIVKTTKHLEAAKKIYDFIMSKDGQQISLNGLVHVVDPEVGAPAGAKPLGEIRQNAFELSDKFFEFVKNEDTSFKSKYSNIMFQ